MWPMVYQGLGVYKEPVQRHTALAAPHHFGALPGDATALSPLPSLDSPPYAQLHADTGVPPTLAGTARSCPCPATGHMCCRDSLTCLRSLFSKAAKSAASQPGVTLMRRHEDGLHE